MASETSCDGHMNEYMIYRHEKLSLLHLLRLLIFRRHLISCEFVESSSSVAGRLEGVPTDFITVLTCALQKILSAIRMPMKWIGRVIEFLVNLLSLNGGVRGLFWNVITVSVVIPRRGAANFRSLIAQLDGRTDLHKSSSWIHNFPLMDTLTGLGETDPLDLSTMAAKVAYENYAYIKNTVTNHWKMHFVGFYSCWNKFLEDKTTQAYIFCNKPEEADLIVLAFRGTEPFNARDWSTDVDLSWLSMGKLGNVHLGFLKALGLQDETDYQKGFPKDLSWSDDKPVAYYVLRDALRTLLKKHSNAKIVVTGHSLGGALAALFPSLLALHEENDILDAIYAVMTYGQPRVGDVTFKKYMESILSKRYYRMVYRYDIVPRVPFDKPPTALFKHCGTCIYYDGWYERQALIDDSPNPNYIDLKYAIPVYLNGLGDLVKALLLGETQGREFKEEFFSILYRASWLILPGVASHSPRDYVNGGRLARITGKDS
ncbi:triacylglycerol lipase OBL1-like [Phoenix dactylifera]|uniref:Triacylglycerol lipase OBL1-like n=1 Tax=Phoenix dactylifera TaxID=42345 RepID=A0A8B7CUT3_PHODC|nr:triacylglycerol lipase OBL1-like [Phoenix dactylifera]